MADQLKSEQQAHKENEDPAKTQMPQGISQIIIPHILNL